MGSPPDGGCQCTWGRQIVLLTNQEWSNTDVTPSKIRVHPCQDVVCRHAGELAVTGRAILPCHTVSNKISSSQVSYNTVHPTLGTSHITMTELNWYGLASIWVRSLVYSMSSVIWNVACSVCDSWDPYYNTSQSCIVIRRSLSQNRAGIWIILEKVLVRPTYYVFTLFIQLCSKWQGINWQRCTVLSNS